jgi:hypothetical protein
MGFIAGSAMTVLVGTARAESTSAAATDALARADIVQTQADAARARVDDLAKAGGWPYKTGLIRGYERQAATYQAQANEARAEATRACTAATAAPDKLARVDVAQMQANATRARVDDLAKAGGWPYKTGLIRGYERQAAAYQAQANEARAEAMGAYPVAASPAVADAQERLANLKMAGGWAWKSGAVRRAEGDLRALEGPSPYLMSYNEALPTSAARCKPVERIQGAFR